MLKFLEFLEKIRPKPFKRFQRWLNIEQEWTTFKLNLRPHKYKILTLTVLCSYPLYQPYLEQQYNRMNISLQSNLEQTKPIAKISESFIKEVVMGVLRDPQIRREGGMFVENLAKRQIVLDNIVTLLSESVKDPVFINEAKHLTKGLAHRLLQDQTIQQDIAGLFVNLLRDPEIKYELTEVTKWVFAQEETKEALVNVCKEGFKDDRMGKATQDLLSTSLHNILMDQETVEKLKLFSFYLLESENKANQNPKGLIDMILDRVIRGGHKGEKSDNQLKRVLKDEGKDDLYESIQARKDASQNDEQDDGQPKKKSFFF